LLEPGWRATHSVSCRLECRISATACSQARIDTGKGRTRASIFWLLASFQHGKGSIGAPGSRCRCLGPFPKARVSRSESRFAQYPGLWVEMVPRVPTTEAARSHHGSGARKRAAINRSARMPFPPRCSSQSSQSTEIEILFAVAFQRTLIPLDCIYRRARAGIRFQGNHFCSC